MKTIETNLELQEAAERAAKGILDLEEARKAASEVDAMREKNRRRYGEEAIGADIIREYRGHLPE